VGLCIIRLQRNRLIETPQRVFHEPQIHVGIAHAEPGAGKIRRKRQRLPIGLNGRTRLTGVAQRISQITVRKRVPRIGVHGFTQPLNPVRRFALLKRKNAEKVQGIRMLRLLPQDFRAQGTGLRGAASLQRVQRLCKRGGDAQGTSRLINFHVVFDWHCMSN
jgi:hypothetical protein